MEVEEARSKEWEKRGKHRELKEEMKTGQRGPGSNTRKSDMPGISRAPPSLMQPSITSPPIPISPGRFSDWCTHDCRRPRCVVFAARSAETGDAQPCAAGTAQVYCRCSRCKWSSTVSEWESTDIRFTRGTRDHSPCVCLSSLCLASVSLCLCLLCLSVFSVSTPNYLPSVVTFSLFLLLCSRCAEGERCTKKYTGGEKETEAKRQKQRHTANHNGRAREKVPLCFTPLTPRGKGKRRVA